MPAEARMTQNRLVWECFHEGLGRAFMCFADADANARQIVQKEIHPMIGRKLDDHIGPRSGDTAPKLAVSARDLVAARLRQQMPVACDERCMTCRKSADELSHVSPRLRLRAIS